MKNIILTVAISAIAGLSAISCNKQLQNETPSNVLAETTPEEFTLTLGVGSGGTKLTSSALESEKQINNVKYYIFDAVTSNIETFCESTASNGQAQVTLSTGEKDIYVVVNSADTLSEGYIDQFLESKLYLKENRPDNFVMTGYKNFTVGSDSQVTIEVQRVVCKVLLNKITTSFTAPAYTKGHFNIDEIFLQCEPAFICLSGDQDCNKWINETSFTETYGGILGESEINVTMYGNTTVPLNYIYFSAPNNRDILATHLVLKAQLNENTCYYRMKLPVLESNKIYTINELTITRPGTGSPTEDITLGTCSMNITVKDWVTGEEVSYTI